jgi:hypothetical protein
VSPPISSAGVAAGDVVVGVFQTLPSGDGVAVVDVAGAGTALDGFVGADTEDRDVAGPDHGQGTVSVLQERHAVGGRLPGQCGISARAGSDSGPSWRPTPAVA